MLWVWEKGGVHLKKITISFRSMAKRKQKFLLQALVWMKMARSLQEEQGKPTRSQRHGGTIVAIRFGICNWTLHVLEKPEGCAWMAEQGLQGVQLDLGSLEDDFPLADPARGAAWKREAQRHGIELCSVMINEVMRHGMTTPAGSEDRRIAELALRRGVEATAGLNLPLMVVPSFRASGLERAGEEEMEATVACLQLACDLAKPHGIVIASENVLSPEGMRELSRRVNRSNFELYLDSFNYSFWSGAHLPDLLPDLLPMNGKEVHVKDGTKEQTGCLPLGQGMSDLAATLAGLQQCRFDGWIFLENFYERPGFVGGDLDVSQLVRQDLAYLRSHLQPLSAEE